MNTPGKTTKLISQTQISGDARDWHLSTLRDIEARLTDPDFPCVFSRNAYRKGLLKFIFVEGSAPHHIRYLAQGLQEYVELSRHWDGRLDTAYPLVVAFAQDAVRAESVEDYHAFGWRILRELHDIDPSPWPESVGKNPHSGSWSMCFDGMPLFCNMSSAAHQVRRSRNLGAHFALIINPRERFDVFAGDSPSGRRNRAKIRARIARYDGVPHSPQLGSYGSGELEWQQYGLLEVNVKRTDACPFSFRSTPQ